MNLDKIAPAFSLLATLFCFIVALWHLSRGEWVWMIINLGLSTINFLFFDLFGGVQSLSTKVRTNE